LVPLHRPKIEMQMYVVDTPSVKHRGTIVCCSDLRCP
jgi:hypothetical protein